MKFWESLVILFCIYPQISVKAETIVVSNEYGTLNQQLCKDNVTYHIVDVFDLGKDTVSIPANCILKFSDSGRLFKGVIEGKNTTIEASRHQIFENITIEGTWSNQDVYSQWVCLKQGGESNNDQFKNLMVLCKGELMTHLYTQEGNFYLSPVEGSAPILIPSNTHWHNSSIIRLRECNYTKYSLVYLNKVNNVTIDGGEFVGDLVRHLGTQGEWGHGIKCGGATNIVLKNLTCKNFWGDGIDLIEGLDSEGKATIICDSILIDNVKCLYNRRQGLSIEAAKNVKVLNSEFCYTGVFKKTDPSAGIDIEPWNDNGRKLADIVIRNCILSNNKGPDLMIYTPKQIEVDRSAMKLINVSVENCQIGFSFVYRVAGIDFRQCNIKDVIRIDYSDFINIDKETRLKRQVMQDNGFNVKIE